MNPEFKKEEIKYCKNLLEIHLGITKVLLEEHKKLEIKPGECECDIQNLEKVKEIQQRRIDFVFPLIQKNKICLTNLSIKHPDLN